MAKTESTAVNELIDLVQSGQPLASEPAAELFSAPPPLNIAAPRVTPPIPALNAAGDVAPLPPRRSPRATSQHAMLPQPIRMSDAEPERGNTIPPISQPVFDAQPGGSTPALPPPSRAPRASTSTPAQRASTSAPAARPSAPPPIPQRAQRASSPPPIPTRPTGAQPAVRATGAQPAVRASSPPPIPSSASSFDPRELASTWTLDDARTPVVGAASFDDEHTPLPPASPFDDDLTPVPGDTPLPIDVAPIETRRRNSAPAPVVVGADELVDPPSAESLPPPPSVDVSPMPAANLPPLPTANVPAASPPPLPRASAPGASAPPPFSANAPGASAPPPFSANAPGASVPPPFSANAPASRPSASLPAPNRSSQRAGSPSFLSRPTVPSMPSLPPPTTPVAAPFRSRTGPQAVVPQQYPVIQRPRTIDATGDVVRAENWFELSTAIPKIEQTDGTALVPRPHSETSRMIKRLILPAVLVGIAAGTFGAYLAVGNQKAAKKRAAAATAVTSPAEAHHTMPVAAPDPASAAAPGVPGTAADIANAANGMAADMAGTANTETVITATAGTETAGTEIAGTEIASAAHAAAPVAPAPAPGAQAPVEAIATAPAAPATAQRAVTFVDVRINSKPQGATVMLVDNGKTSFLGTTPLATSLDPSRRYDVIFTLSGRPTQMEPLDPTKTTSLDVTLGRGTSSHHAKAAPTPAIERAVADTSAAKAERAPSTPKAARVASEKRAEKAEHTSSAAKAERAAPEKRVAKAERKAAGEGTLMVSSKPPCEILIDGKRTGLTTPQRSIELAAGTHKVTFINSSAGINKTVAVSIRADKPTKLIQDLMNR